jgi:hypothetical protein
VLLDLARKIRPEIEVIHFKLPFLSHKYAFHHVAQETYGMTVHDWVPVSVALTHGKNRIDVCETYSLGDGSLKVMRGTEPREAGMPWVCGKEWLNRPKAHVVSDFDVLLCGHKSSDEDPLTGSVPLEIDKKILGSSTEMWFPLRHWTDQDISSYIKVNGVDFDKNRYNDNVVSRPDKHMNTDYVHACFNCVDKRLGKFVDCPKYGIQVENVHEHVLHEQPVAEYCNIRSGLQNLRSVLQPQVELAGVAPGQG